jgi:hypothetical protein
MLRSRTFALLAALAALAFPASSLAQSAGDDQYQDPLAGQGNGGDSGNSGNSGSSGSGTPTTPAAPTTPPASGGSEGTAPQATPAASPSGQLPRTGFDVVLTIELGLALLLTGVVTQRTLVLRDRRDNR